MPRLSPAQSARSIPSLAEFQDIPSEKTKSHNHPGIEFLYLLDGTLDIKIGNEGFAPDASDLIEFDSAVQQLPRW
jgi:hypothetical protein